MQTSFMRESLQHLPNIPEAHELAQLQAQMQRPARNINADGGFELGWGTALLFFGLGSYLSVILPKSVWASPVGPWIGYVPLSCAAFAPYAIPKIIKRAITWPRTGYVANPQDLKFTQLLLLMIFGLALGYCLSMPFILFSEISEVLNRSGPHRDSHTIILQAIKLLICVILAIYLGRKVIRKPPPVASAYDAAIIGQNPAGRKRLRAVKIALFALFFGVPILVAGLVFGLMYWSNSKLHNVTGQAALSRGMATFNGQSLTETHWSQWGMPSFLVAANAMLYLMGSGVVMKEHRWKWLMLAIMIIGPIVVAPLIPFPVPQIGLMPILEPLPPVMLTLGLTWFVSGAVTLILFIRRNPLPGIDGT
jgi:hypothetical protein